MAQIVSHASFRALRACRLISHSNSQIIGDLERIRGDTEKARLSLQDAGKRLEKSLDHFDQARNRLDALNEQHETVMRVVDKIMENSPVFAQIRS